MSTRSSLQELATFSKLIPVCKAIDHSQYVANIKDISLFSILTSRIFLDLTFTAQKGK